MTTDYEGMYRMLDGKLKFCLQRVSYYYYTDGKHFYRGNNLSYRKMAGLKYVGSFHDAKEAKTEFNKGAA